MTLIDHHMSIWNRKAVHVLHLVKMKCSRDEMFVQVVIIEGY